MSAQVEFSAPIEGRVWLTPRVREATFEDVPAIVRMGRKFHELAGNHRYIEYDDDATANFVRLLIESPSGAIFVLDAGDVVGMIGGALHRPYMNPAHLTGGELFWWVEPEFRGNGKALMVALEEWARASGARTFQMMAMESVEPERVGAIYRRMGYELVEHSFTKVL